VPYFMTLSQNVRVGTEINHGNLVASFDFNHHGDDHSSRGLRGCDAV
jgi:hypothetical protein